MEYDAVKENEFTFEMGEVCAEDFDNKSLWMLKLSYDFDMSNLPQAVPLKSFIKVNNSKDLIGKAYAPSKISKELKQLVLSGEMKIVENALETDEILTTAESDNTASEFENNTFKENDKKKHKRHRTLSSEYSHSSNETPKKKNKDP